MREEPRSPRTGRIAGRPAPPPSLLGDRAGKATPEMGRGGGEGDPSPRLGGELKSWAAPPYPGAECSRTFGPGTSGVWGRGGPWESGFWKGNPMLRSEEMVRRGSGDRRCYPSHIIRSLLPCPQLLPASPVTSGAPEPRDFPQKNLFNKWEINFVLSPRGLLSDSQFEGRKGGAGGDSPAACTEEALLGSSEEGTVRGLHPPLRTSGP